MLALDAISAGLGAMFPTPALAILIMHELTLAAGLNIFAANYMERVTTSLFGAILSWTVFNKLGGKHILPNFHDGTFGTVPGAGIREIKSEFKQNKKNGFITLNIFSHDFF